jgi:hypothetical protein
LNFEKKITKIKKVLDRYKKEVYHIFNENVLIKYAFIIHFLRIGMSGWISEEEV